VADFTLEPDEPDLPRTPQRVRMVSTGLAPTQDVPLARGKGKDAPPAYAPCEACGRPVLLGETRAGTRLVLDVHVQIYVVSWDKGAKLPRLVPSRGYPLHWCESGTTGLAG
jgi:hypothetical protein